MTVISLVAGSRLEDRQIGDELGRALGLEAQAGAVIAALAMAERSDEVDAFDKAARRLAHDDENLTAGDGYLGRTAAAGKPGLRLLVGSDHRGVEIGEAIDLRAAEKSDREALRLAASSGTFRAPRRW